MRVTVLCGGFGAARFVGGAVAVVDDLTCIVNVGDDFDYLGLRICPDLDSVLYALAGQFDESRGWGPADDTFVANRELARYDSDWFHLGDKDLALSLYRTAGLHRGESLSAVTADAAAAWGIAARLLPSSDQSVPTRIITDDGELSFQDFVVRRKAQPAVRDVIYGDVAAATTGPDVCNAIASADVVILGPSNPVSSIGAILSLPGVREVLMGRRAPTVAVTPVVTSRSPRTSAEADRFHLREIFMAWQGVPHRSAGVASQYRDLIDGFVVDERDRADEALVAVLGLQVLLADTLVETASARADLARRIVNWTASLEPVRRIERHQDTLAQRDV